MQGIFGKRFILAFLSSAAFRLQNRVSDFFKIVLFGRQKALLRVPWEMRLISRLKIKISKN